MGRDGHESSNVVQSGLEASGPLGQIPCDAANPHPVDPAFEHCRLRAPPRGVDEDDGVAPLQVLEVRLEVGFGRRGFEVGTTFGESESRVEGFGVQISNPYGCAAISNPAFDSES